MRHLLHATIAASALLIASGCEQKDDRVVGKWVVAGQTLDIKKDGNFTVVEDGKENTGTWERYGPDLYFTMAGQQTICALNTDLQNQLVLSVKDDANPEKCKFPSPYWRVDLPVEKRAASLVAFTCETKSQRIGRMPYTSTFRIEADKNDKLACFGRTGDGCQMVWFAKGIADDRFSMLVTWGDGTGDSFDIEKNQASKLELRQSSSKACRVSAGMLMCEFGSYTPVGTCEKATP